MVEDGCPPDEPCRIARVLTNGSMVAVYCQHGQQMPQLQGYEHEVGPAINRARGNVPWEDYSVRRETPPTFKTAWLAWPNHGEG